MTNKTFFLPDLGEGLPDAEIVEWMVKVGDTIKLDEPLVSMETAKAVVELPSPYSGRVLRVAGGAGDAQQLARIRRRQFDDRLCGFHGNKRFVELDRIAHLHHPLDDLGVGQAFTQVGQEECLVGHLGSPCRLSWKPGCACWQQ